MAADGTDMKAWRDMKVCFLDFDGVLISRQSFMRKEKGQRAEPTPETVAALNKFFDATAAKVVVSSVWRLGRPHKWLQCVLDAWGVRAEIIGETPELSRQVNGLYHGVQRGYEIQAWLREHSQREPRDPTDDVEAFVIVDDDADMAHLEQWLVQTDFETGFTEADAGRAAAVLNRKYIEPVTAI